MIGIGEAALKCVVGCAGENLSSPQFTEVGEKAFPVSRNTSTTVQNLFNQSTLRHAREEMSLRRKGGSSSAPFTGTSGKTDDTSTALFLGFREKRNGIPENARC